jgi:hypothetical protein
VALVRAAEAQTAATRAQTAVAQRTPTPLESFAWSVASTAVAIVLAGVVLILIADAVNLIPEIDRWPLVTLIVVLIAVAVLAASAGWRHRLEMSARDLSALWTAATKLEALETGLVALDTKIDALLLAQRTRLEERDELEGEPPATP